MVLETNFEVKNENNTDKLKLAGIDISDMNARQFRSAIVPVNYLGMLTTFDSYDVEYFDVNDEEEMTIRRFGHDKLKEAIELWEQFELLNKIEFFNCADHDIQWSKYDAIEIQASINRYNSDSNFEICPLDKASVVTIYGHLTSGDCEEIHDFRIENGNYSEIANKALMMATALCVKHNLCHGVMDFT